MATNRFSFEFDFPTTITATNGLGFISYSAANVSDVVGTNPWISDLDSISQETEGELIIPIPAGCLRCTVTFALEVGEGSGEAVLTATDEFWRTISTEAGERGILAYPIPSTEKTYNPGPQLVTVPTTVSVTISPTGAVPWRATRMMVVWVVDELVYLKSIVPSTLSDDNLKTSNRATVSAFASTMRDFWTAKRTADTKIQGFKQDGFVHSYTITETHDGGDVGVEYRYTFPDHTFYPESQTTHDPGAALVAPPFPRPDPDGSQITINTFGSVLSTLLLTPGEFSIRDQYKALQSQVETYRSRRFVAIELRNNLSNLVASSVRTRVFVPPGTAYIECEYISPRSPLTPIAVQCSMGNAAPQQFISKVNAFKPTGYVLQTLMSGNSVLFGKHVKTTFPINSTPSLHQVPQQAGVTGFKNQNDPSGMSSSSPFPISLQVPWSATPDVLSTTESDYTSWKVFIPPNTKKLTITASLPFWTRYAWAMRLGDPPSRTDIVEPEEYLQLKRSKTSASEVYTTLIAGQDVYGVAPGIVKMPPLDPGDPPPTEYSFTLLSWDIRSTSPDVASRDLPALDEGTWLYFRLLNPADTDIPDDAIIPPGDPTKDDFNDEMYYGYQREIFKLTLNYQVDADTYYNDYARLVFGTDGDPTGIYDEISYVLDTYDTAFTTNIGTCLYIAVHNQPTNLSEIDLRVKMLVDERYFKAWIDNDSAFSATGVLPTDPYTIFPGSSAFETWVDEQGLNNES